MTVWRTGLTACYCKETSSLNMDLIDKPHRPAPRSLPISTEKDKKPIFLSLKVVDTVEGLIFLINAVDDFVPPNNQFPSVTRKNQGRIEETISFPLTLYSSRYGPETILFSVTFRKMFGKCSESCYFSSDLKAEVACRDPAYEVIVFSALYICLLKKL